MAQVTTDQVIARLRGVKGPDLKEDIVTLGLVSSIVIKEEGVYFSIAVDPSRAAELEPMRLAAEQAVSGMDGVARAVVVLTAHDSGDSVAHVRPQGRAHDQAGLSRVKHIVAIASGKGGVGKSTTAVNLALAFQANGLRCGLLDADIYGPSIPRLLDVTGRPHQVAPRVLEPLEKHGLKIMSMGLLLDEETPTIWRGPMVISALTQMLNGVRWGEMDMLVIDTPPGTGDVQLTMAQKVPLAGVVIISTPQDLALIDARKGANMFSRVNVPILGVVENMSYFLCRNCGERSDIFGHGGAQREAIQMSVPFLGEIPLDIAIRESSDRGSPTLVSCPDGPHARIYRDIADKILAGLQNS